MSVRKAIVRVPYEELLSMIGTVFPYGVEALSVHVNYEIDSVDVVVCGETLEEVPNGCALPRIQFQDPAEFTSGQLIKANQFHIGQFYLSRSAQLLMGTHHGAVDLHTGSFWPTESLMNTEYKEITKAYAAKLLEKA